MPTPSMEDHIEQIYMLIEQKGYARVSDIAESLSVLPSSVTKMVQKLDKDGYLIYERYRGLMLTPKGLKLGKRLVQRHVFIVKSKGLPAFVRMASAILRGKLEEDPDVVVIKTEKVRIETSKEMTCNLDGDERCSTPIAVKILKKHIEVLVPIGEMK